MKVASTAVAALLGCVLSTATGCAASTDQEVQDDIGQKKIIGKNDLTPVLRDGANLPKRYRGLVDAFALIKPMGCTGTHVGNGLVLTAGHCFEAGPSRVDNKPCPGVTFKWGLRKDKAAYMTSTCTVVLAAEQSDDRDYAIVKVDPAPPVEVAMDIAARPENDSVITIFSHPNTRPLEWSKTCGIRPASLGGYGLDQFSHQCDTEPGSSGATILSNDSLAVVGIHDGGLVPWNYGTFLSDTPIAEFVGAGE